MSNDFEFSSVSEEDTEKILFSLSNSKAAGMDQIQAKVLRDGAHKSVLPLKNVANLSIKLSTLTECKLLN